MDIIELKDTTSTNDFLLAQNTDKELCAVANYQSAGRGMGTNRWESEDGKNLLFSFLIHPAWVLPRNQYVISMLHALALVDVLSEYSDGFTIKWPNDIYWHDKKISGTLIDGSIKGGRVSDMVIGTGVNINQREFHSDAPNPVSLYQITGEEHSVFDVLNKIIDKFQYYKDIAHRECVETGESETIMRKYHDRLYRRDGIYTYEDKDGRFKAELVKVLPNGIMQLRKTDGEICDYEFKEVKFIL